MIEQFFGCQKIGVSNRHFRAHLNLRQLRLVLWLVLVVNLGEDRERDCGRHIPFDETSLGLGLLEEGLEGEELGHVVVLLQLLHGPMLVIVDAPNTEHTMLRLQEHPAVLALVLFKADSGGSLGNLVLSVGEAALIIVATKAGLSPIFAHLSLVV